MKVLVGCFYHETNTFNPLPTEVKHFTWLEGEKSAEKVAATKVFLDEGIEVIPSIYASALSSGIVTLETYRFFVDKIIHALKENKDIDGVWLHIHGAMVVEEVGSGELALIKEIREIIGDSIPISLTMDIHGNIALDFYKHINIVKSYRTVPHIDQAKVERETAKFLVDCIKHQTNIRPAFTRLPMIIPGEQALERVEPLRSIFQKLTDIEKRKGILTASFFICHAWSDSENTASSVFVVPISEEYQQEAEQAKDELANYIYDKRDEFDFDAIILEPEETIDYALTSSGKPVFISDSGDNTTAGALGMSTDLLQIITKKEINEKKVLIAAIHDPVAFEKLQMYEVGEKIVIEVGMNIDENSRSIQITGQLQSKGELLGYLNVSDSKVGDVCTVSTGNVSIIIANRAESFITLRHFEKANVQWKDYDIIIVKQGYLFNELAEVAELEILAMTRGATNQKIHQINYKHIPRPLFPLD